MFQLLDGLLQVGFSVFGLQLFSHGKRHRGLIQCLVGLDGHLYFLSDSQEQETSLWLAKGDLSDDFVEALRKQLFSDRADSALTGLSLHQLLIEHLSESGDIHSRGGLVTDVLDEVLAALDPLSGWQDSIQNVLVAWLVFHRRELSLLRTYSFKYKISLLKL